MKIYELRNHNASRVDSTYCVDLQDVTMRLKHDFESSMLHTSATEFMSNVVVNEVTTDDESLLKLPACELVVRLLNRQNFDVKSKRIKNDILIIDKANTISAYRGERFIINTNVEDAKFVGLCVEVDSLTATGRMLTGQVDPELMEQRTIDRLITVMPQHLTRYRPNVWVSTMHDQEKRFTAKELKYTAKVRIAWLKEMAEQFTDQEIVAAYQEAMWMYRNPISKDGFTTPMTKRINMLLPIKQYLDKHPGNAALDIFGASGSHGTSEGYITYACWCVNEIAQLRRARVQAQQPQ